MRKLLFLLTLPLLFSCVTSVNITSLDNQVTPLEGTRWILTELAGLDTLKSEKKAFIQFSSKEANLTGNAGCNNFFGSYELKENTLRIGPLGATRMLCQDMSVEDNLFQVLEKVSRFEITGDRLTLYAGDESVAVFEATSLVKE